MEGVARLISSFLKEEFRRSVLRGMQGLVAQSALEALREQAGPAPLQRSEPRRAQRRRVEEPRLGGPVRVRERRQGGDRRSAQGCTTTNRQAQSRIGIIRCTRASSAPANTSRNASSRTRISRRWSRPRTSGSESRTGIEHRHIAADDEATSDLAYKAGLAALESAGLDAERHRSRDRRHHDARFDLPERRLPRAGQARDQELPCVQPRSRLLGFPLRPRRRRSVHSVGAGAACARHRRRDDVAHHRLEGSRDLRAVRRRRRCGDPRGRRDPRHPLFDVGRRRALPRPAVRLERRLYAPAREGDARPCV